MVQTEPASGAGASPAGRRFPTLADFRESGSADLFEKCERFARFAEGLAPGMLDRLELLRAIDHRILVAEPGSGRRRELVCFDSNSYLGLHLHPRVVSAARRALDEAGAGMPSAQLLAGTHRWLRELEDTVAAFHGRPAAIVFASGYAANVGTLTGLLRTGDLAARDRFSHASIHDGCRWSGARLGVFGHRNLLQLEALLDSTPAVARLIVSDGTFSMHGDLAPLPELRAAADRYGARLMIDEAHSVGVLGATGRGLEEHFGRPGCIDVLMGTFSKAPGGVGGYVCGSEALVRYLRYFARSSMFTASLPPATCAALNEAFHVMQEEPEHREQLWRVARRLWERLSEAGFSMARLESPIITLPVGSTVRLLRVSAELCAMGLKCGSVTYPAVPAGQSLLRLTANARHTEEDLDRAASVLAQVARRHDILGCTAAELLARDEEAGSC